MAPVAAKSSLAAARSHSQGAATRSISQPVSSGRSVTISTPRAVSGVVDRDPESLAARESTPNFRSRSMGSTDVRTPKGSPLEHSTSVRTLRTSVSSLFGSAVEGESITAVDAISVVTLDPMRRAHDDVTGEWRQTVEIMDRWQATPESMESSSSSVEGDNEGEDDEESGGPNVPYSASSTRDSLGTEEVGGESQPKRPARRKPQRCWRACPGLHRWIKQHMGSPAAFFGILGFLLLDAFRREIEEISSVVTVNPQSISVMTHLVTLIVAVVTCVIMDGWWAVGKIADYHYFWRWAVVASFLIASYYLQAEGVRMQLNDTWVSMLQYANMPISLLIGSFALQHRYGKLEWLAVSMLSLGIGTLIILRVRCMDAACEKIQVNWDHQKPWGIVCILSSIFIQMVAWSLAERILKAKSQGVIRIQGCRRREELRTMIVHLSFCQLVIQSCIWVYHGVMGSGSILDGVERRPVWFGHWTLKHFVLVFVYMSHMFLSCHIIKHFSVVSWVLCGVVATVFAHTVGDGIQSKFHIEKRALQGFLIGGIIVLSAVIFQTGRLNILALQKRLGVQKPEPKAGSWLESLRALLPAHRRAAAAAAALSATRSTSSLTREAPGEETETHSTGTSDATRAWRIVQVLVKYSSVIIYILAQALRENLSQKAQSGKVIVPQSLNVATAFFGLLLSVFTTLWNHGWEGLKSAWNIKKLIKFMFPALLFAASAFLGSMAFAMGTSAAAKDAAGRIYTPAAAILSRWILGKYYMWLEWLALIILTMSSMSFGLLDTMESKTKATVSGLVCAAASGIVAALNSLVMEKLMKKETDPYVVQSVRLSFGSLVFNIMFLFVMGWIGDAEQPPRPDFGFWNWRPVHVHCAGLGTCGGDGVFTYHKPFDGTPLCHCDRGIFVGWSTQWFVYAALAASVVYSWVTGLVVKQFSSVYRSVADGAMLLVVYFALTPLLDQTAPPFDEFAKTFVVLIVPLSGTTFSYAALEMQKAMRVAEVMHAADHAHGDGDVPKDSTASSVRPPTASGPSRPSTSAIRSAGVHGGGSSPEADEAMAPRV